MDEFSLVSLQDQQIMNTTREVLACNAVSERFGLSLTEDAVRELMECRSIALKNTGRVEFSGGVLPKLIYAFCDSPYLDRDNYETALAQLQEAFYYFKSDSGERYTDDELIEWMLAVFNGRAQGCAEYLLETSWDDLRRYARGGYDPQSADEAGDLF